MPLLIIVYYADIDLRHIDWLLLDSDIIDIAAIIIYAIRHYILAFDDSFFIVFKYLFLRHIIAITSDTLFSSFHFFIDADTTGLHFSTLRFHIFIDWLSLHYFSITK